MKVIGRLVSLFKFLFVYGLSDNADSWRKKYGKKYDLIAACLFKHDPGGVNYDFNSDEYHPEASYIVSKLPKAQSPVDVQKIVYRVICDMFDKSDAGPFEDYESLANDIWEIWKGP